MTDLVEARGVPGFSDHLGVGQGIVQLDLPDDGRVRERRAVLAAREDRPFVKPEAVDVRLLDPEAETVDDQLLRNRVVRIERVADSVKLHSARLFGSRDSVRLSMPLNEWVGP